MRGRPVDAHGRPLTGRVYYESQVGCDDDGFWATVTISTAGSYWTSGKARLAATTWESRGRGGRRSGESPGVRLCRKGGGGVTKFFAVKHGQGDTIQGIERKMSVEQAVQYARTALQEMNMPGSMITEVSIKPEPEIHKAEPHPLFSDICRVCGTAVKKVPGGQGTTFVHSDTGTVVGQGGEL